MSVTWNKKYAEAEIENLINEAKQLTLDHLGLGIHSIIATALDFHKDVLYKDAEKLVLDTLNNIDRNRINKQNFLEQINELELGFLRQPKTEYHVVTGISIRNKCRIEPIAHENVEIRFYNKEPSKYKRGEFLGDIVQVLHSPELPNDYKAIVLKINARSEYEAGVHALETLDFVLSTWNFVLNHSHGKMQFFQANKPSPINKIVKGPIHTIHLPSGELTEGRIYYYEPDYYGPVECYDITQSIRNMKKFEWMVKNIVKKHNKWGNKVRNSLIRYTRALEKCDHASSFLDMWSILELLALTSSNENHREIVQRVSNIYADSPIHKTFINFIREIRNSLVHQSEFNFHRTNLLYEIKDFVEGLILYHFAAMKIFENYGEAIQFIDLPDDEREIKKRIRLLKKYHKIRFSET